MKIISKTDNIEIQDLKLNRGNCEHDQNFLVKLIQETANAYLFVSEKEKAIKNHQAKIARLQKDLEELTQYVQQFNNLDKLLENISDILNDKAHGKFKLLNKTISYGVTANDFFLAKSLTGIGVFFLDGSSHKYTKNDNPIYVAKRILDNYNYQYEPSKEPPNEKLWNVLDNIIGAIEDTKNPKDYPYINLKELKKLIDSIVDNYGNMVDNFLNKDDPRNYEVSKKGLQSLAKLKSMWPSVGKFYFAYLKKAIPRQAKEYTDKLIGSEAEAIQNINKLEQLIKDLESKKNTMAVDLKFGETFTAHYKCQNLIEVGVKTDKGAWTFNFDR